MIIEIHNREAALFSIRHHAEAMPLLLAPPIFNLAKRTVRGLAVGDWTPTHAVPYGRGGCVQSFSAILGDETRATLHLDLQTNADSPVVRFRYRIEASCDLAMTRPSGRDELIYTAADADELDVVTELRFSEFRAQYHSFMLQEEPVRPSAFEDGLAVMGPMLVVASEKGSWLLAYEHGSSVPDAFVHFRLNEQRKLRVEAVKGNYHHGRLIGPGKPYETIWLQAARVAGSIDDLARQYRTWVLNYQSSIAESRKPYIFYNTWNFQERNKHWNGQTYLASMNQERILQEIDVAHEMGVEVFVIDTGWYSKTGDWRVDLKKFPDGLGAVRAKLEGYGMKLGLWFNPTAAARSSSMWNRHQNAAVETGGKIGKPQPIWETEESYTLCLVSDYAEAFAEELIRLHREVGVSYFKWDAISQYGCGAPGHHHGTNANDECERRNCFAFEMVRAMARVVEKLCAACPEAIVDFDITEARRAVGLSFLSVGKYFLINNGPYFDDYDLPSPQNGYVNMMVHPGPARAWICRAPLTYDRWIPSILFLTHYLPDDPEPSQWINIASLILGQNGIWGDLLAVSAPGVDRFKRSLALYKEVRNAITASYPVRAGGVGGAPEVHEKIEEASGSGVVVIFSPLPGDFTYVTENKVNQNFWSNMPTEISFDQSGRAKITTTFTDSNARIIFFGVNSAKA